MADGMKDIIKRLEQQRAAIERALSALREAEGTANAAAESSSSAAPAKRRGRRKGGMTPEGRKRLSEALKARWAVKRANQGGEGATAKKAARRGRKKAAA